jgi:glycerophosphoryl diester phosphodiesterase
VTTAPLVVAHRGSSAVAPQNTFAAFEAAWRAGAAMIELDVRLAADGEIVVIHDDAVDATTDGSGLVSELTVAELRALDAGSWFAPAYAGQRIPPFGEALTFLADHDGSDLLVELKGVWAPHDAARLAAAVDAAGVSSRVVVQSFSPQTVAALRDVAPHLRRGWLVEQRHESLLEVCAELGAIACNPSLAMVMADRGLVALLHRAGLQVMVWTADDVDEWAALVHDGVDAIITDRPDRLSGWLAGRLGA